MATLNTYVAYNKLPAIAAKFPALVRELVDDERFDFEADVKDFIVSYNAVDTGNMLNSVFSRMIGEHSAEILSPAHYSAYVNYGTYKMAARPFFSDAVERSRQRFPQRFNNLEAML